MQRRLKERLIGAAVLVMLAVIFIPMLLDNSVQKGTEITDTNIPRRPENEFSSRIKPLEDAIVPREEVREDKQPVEVSLPPVQPATNTPQQQEPVKAEMEVATSREAPEEAVRTEVAKAPEQPVPAVVPEGNAGLIAWVVQIGSFSSEENAKLLNDRARSLGFTAFVEPVRQDTGTSYRVRVGPELSRSDASVLVARLKDAMQVDGMIMQYP